MRWVLDAEQSHVASGLTAMRTMPCSVSCTRMPQSAVAVSGVGFVPPVQPLFAVGAQTWMPFAPNTSLVPTLHEQLQV
jgi:hypothetical protein